MLHALGIMTLLGRWSGAHPTVVLRRRTLRFIVVPCHDRSSPLQGCAQVVVGPGAWRNRAPGHSLRVDDVEHHRAASP
jgi:hypothetical protein